MNDFGADSWQLVWRGLDQPGLIESVFSLANGRIGVRASLEQGGAGHETGTLVNGFHETWPIRVSGGWSMVMPPTARQSSTCLTQPSWPC